MSLTPSAEVHVNRGLTSGDQSRPAVTLLSNDSYLVSWTHGNGNVLGQLYSPSGVAIGDIQVLAYALAPHEYALTPLAQGGFTLAYHGAGQVAGADAMTLLRFDDAGVRVGAATFLNAGPDSESDPAVTGLDSGGVAVAWRSGDKLFLQTIDATGAAVGAPRLIDEPYRAEGGAFEILPRSPSITQLAGGEIVVAWHQTGDGPRGSHDGLIGAQRFSAAGSPIGDEIVIRTASEYLYYPDVTATPDGGFLIAFSDGNDSQNRETPYVTIQKYAADGAPAWTTKAPSLYQAAPQLDVHADGSFALVWSAGQVDGDVQIQKFSASGAPIGAPTRVNSHTADAQTTPDIEILDDGSYAVAWRSVGQDGDQGGIYLSRVTEAPGTVDGKPFIAGNGGTAGSANFYEDDLPNGTSPDPSKLVLTGAVIAPSADGYKSITVGGHTVVADGVFAPSSYQTAQGQKFSFDTFNASTGELSYTYTLQQAARQEQVAGQYPVARDQPMIVVTDNDGDTAQAVFLFSIGDDQPIYRSDDTSVAAGSTTPLSGNLRANDTPGADGWGGFNVSHNGNPASALDAQGFRTLQGTYGTLRFNDAGDYSYALNATTPAGSVEQFTYTASDADGSGPAGGRGMPFKITVTGGASSSGQVLVAEQPGDTLAGGTGADTLVASQGPDQLTGGGGADHFAFEALPWSAGVITDFAVGSDKIDLTALYEASGYTGANAVADNYVRFESDGAGGTRVMYDTDGAGSAQAWAYHVTTLQGVTSSSLSNADLAGGSSQPAAPTMAFSPRTTFGAMEGSTDGWVTPIRFEVTLSSPAAQDVWATWTAGPATPTGTYAAATADDFGADQFPSGKVFFSAGSTMATFVVNVVADKAFEPTEMFKVTLSDLVGAQAGHVTAHGVIGNDDAAPAAGQVIYSPGPGSTVTGGAGADTLYASQGADVLTGAAGGDAFVFRALPWNAGRITDFSVGSDRLDLSSIFQASGYTGADPIADQRISLTSDGSGGTRVYFDRDAPGAGDWPFLVTTLQGVSPAGLTWAQLSGGASTPPPSSSISFSGTGASAANEGTGENGPTIGIAISRTNATGPASVDWTLTPSGANPVDANDFAGGLPAGGTVNFTASEQTKYIVLTLNRDADPEPDEMFTIQLTNPQGGVIGRGSTVVTIRNDDGPPPPSGEGQVLTSSNPGDTLAGGAGNDTLNASQGPDQLTGAGGADRFVFAKPPWSAGVITDFAAGSDKIDVSALLDAYTGSNPIADGWMRLDNASGSTKVYVDIDGAGGEWPFLITTLQGVAPSSVSLSDFVL